VGLPAPVILRCHAPFFAQFIEADDVLFFTPKLPISAKSRHFFGLDLENLGFVVSKRCQTVTVSWRRFPVPESGDFECVVSLFHSFFLQQFCSPFFGFFRLVPGSVEDD
jgi:hypothetical protein